MKRREWLAASAAATLASAAETTKPKLLLPSDQPDEFGFRLMWYNPVPPIDQVKYRLRVGGFADKSAAKGVCQQLSAAGQACILAGK